MIGAVIAQRKARAGMEVIFGGRDLAKAVAMYADHATLSQAGTLPISGVHRGRDAIEAYFKEFFDHYPEMKVTVKDVFVSNIFAMGATNNSAIEYDLEYTNREGKTFRNSGVSVARVKNGKIVSSKEYIFDADISKEAWGEN
jgi:ketosteroid isomerase-like protein